MKGVVSSREEDAAKQGPSPQQSSPYKARPKNEAGGGIGDTATAQQQSRRGRQQMQAVMKNGQGIEPSAAVPAVDAAVTPAGTASNKSVLPKRGNGANKRGGSSGQRTNGSGRGGGGDDGVQKKIHRGGDVLLVSRCLRSFGFLILEKGGTIVVAGLRQ